MQGKYYTISGGEITDYIIEDKFDTEDLIMIKLLQCVSIKKPSSNGPATYQFHLFANGLKTLEKESEFVQCQQ